MTRRLISNGRADLLLLARAHALQRAMNLIGEGDGFSRKMGSVIDSASTTAGIDLSNVRILSGPRLPFVLPYSLFDREKATDFRLDVLNMSQGDVGERSGVSQQSVSSYERKGPTSFTPHFRRYFDFLLNEGYQISDLGL